MSARNIVVGFLSLLFLAFLSIAQQKDIQKVEIKKVPITNVDPTSGEQMYVSYCAACHGRDGKGYGPAAPALKTAPPDLAPVVETGRGHAGARAHRGALVGGDVPAADAGAHMGSCVDPGTDLRRSGSRREQHGRTGGQRCRQ